MPQKLILKTLISLAKQSEQVAALWLYGSRARGTEQSTSDYDLAVMFQTFEPGPFERRIRPELLAMDWQRALAEKRDESVEISIVDIDQVPVPLAFTIVSDNYVLHTKDECALMFKEQQIMSKWEIDYLHHVRHYA